MRRATCRVHRAEFPAAIKHLTLYRFIFIIHIVERNARIDSILPIRTFSIQETCRGPTDIMTKVTHLIAAIMASSAIAWPFGPSAKGYQAPICDQSPSKTQSEPSAVIDAVLFPPTRLASVTNVILRIYTNTRCNGTNFSGEYDVPPGTCYYFPGEGAELLYHSCGQGRSQFPTSCLSFYTFHSASYFILDRSQPRRSLSLLLSNCVKVSFTS